MEGRGIDVLLGNYFDSHLLLTALFNRTIDYTEST